MPGRAAYGAYDLFVSGVASLEIIGGGMVRITFTVNQSNDGRVEAHPADFALVMPLSAIPDGIGKALSITARAVFTDASGNMMLMN
jgi:hypothetical protein